MSADGTIEPGGRVLAYADRTTEAVSRTASSEAHVRAAIICGALPLAVGTLTFGLFLLTRSEALFFVGLGTIAIGLILFLVGCFDLLAYAFVERALRGKLEPAVRKRMGMAALLLLSNFPVASVYVWIVLRFLLPGASDDVP